MASHTVEKCPQLVVRCEPRLTIVQRRRTPAGHGVRGQKDAPEFAENEISSVLKGVVYLDLEVSSSVVVCRGLLVLGISIWDGYDLGTGGGDDVLVFCTGLLWRHEGREGEKRGSTESRCSDVARTR